MVTVRLACDAMATRFEFVLHGQHESQIRAAGEEALHEIRRIEAALNLYHPASEIHHANLHAAHHPVHLSPEVFRLLQHAILLGHATHGAFDITAAPLLRAWGLMRGTGQVPSPRELDAARACVGFQHLHLDESNLTVRFLQPGLILDLGAIGKGYALDRAAESLRENGVSHALLHGGTSSVVALGHPPADVADAWRIAIGSPASFALSPTPTANPSPTDDQPIALVDLHDESFAVSAVWGKGFESNGHFYGHVIDPRTGCPVDHTLLAAIALPAATDSDAVSTALLVRGAEMVEHMIASQAPGRCLVLERSPTHPGFRAIAKGISPRVS